MSLFGSLNVAVSGMGASQVQLSVIGHNLANANTYGYSRQQVIQSDFTYMNIGSGQVGLGTNIEQVRQIRNEFLDISYRTESSKMAYYGPLIETGSQIELLLGELNSDTSTQSVIQDMWDALNELSLNPDNIDSRGIFISTAINFVDKMQTVYEGLKEQQLNINTEIKSTIEEINHYVSEVDKYNTLIKSSETTGDSANDYRDARNIALDNLSQIANITYKSKSDGTVDILLEGNPLLSNGSITNVGLKYTSPNSPFVEPVYTNNSASDILPYDSDAVPLFTLDDEIDQSKNEDGGYLKGLLVSRGSGVVNYKTEEEIRANKPDATDLASYPLGLSDPAYKKDLEIYEKAIFNIEQAAIPKMMANLDTLFNSVVTLINDAVAPQNHDPNSSPVGIDDEQSQFMEIFSRKYMDRYDGTDTYIEEDGSNPYTLYSLGNIVVNEELLNPDNYDKISLSNSGDVSDTTLIQDMLDKWKEPIVKLPKDGEEYYDGLGIEASYNFIVTENAADTREAQSFYDAQSILVNQVANNKLVVSGVSVDEEMSKMAQYQYSYEASARVLNTVDTMLETLLNM